jgi:hypothetical protein
MELAWELSKRIGMERAQREETTAPLSRAASRKENGATCMKTTVCTWTLMATLWLSSPALAAGTYHEVTYDAATEPGELVLGVTYTLWIPADIERLRGVIVHQHGCGVGACKGGETAAYDLHWQELARKWNCALLGPSYHQEEGQNCRLWCDPRNGSERTYLRALEHFATEAGHPELNDVPWCLWGHSGGAFWASLMQTLHPERTVAVWCRSGTAFPYWEIGEIPQPDLSEGVFQIPVICNPGVKERDDDRFRIAWEGSMAMFQAYRKRGAPIGFAPDPRTGHECGDSRYLAIPFFDACLAMRLPDPESPDQMLKPVDGEQAWLAEPLAEKAVPAGEFRGDSLTAVWLPDERIATAWSEYVRTGSVGDSTPPPAPTNVSTTRTEEGVQIRWEARADFESGLRAFLILRDGEIIAQIPPEPKGRFGRPLFQTMSYHDTPEQPLPEKTFLDSNVAADASPEYQVISINSVGLKSAPSDASEQQSQ